MSTTYPFPVPAPVAPLQEMWTDKARAAALAARKAKHPQGLADALKKGAGDLKTGDGSVSLPDGYGVTRIRKLDRKGQDIGQFAVHKPGGKTIHSLAPTREQAVSKALDVSAGHMHADSVGGLHPHASFADAVKAHEGPEPPKEIKPTKYRGKWRTPDGKTHATAYDAQQHIEKHLSEALQEKDAPHQKASTITAHEPLGTKGLFGIKGEQLPALVQHLAKDFIAKGRDRSGAIRLALGICRNWSQGHDGNGHKVSAQAQAAGAKAMAEWEKSKAKAKVTESAMTALDRLALAEAVAARVELADDLITEELSVRYLNGATGDELQSVAEAAYFDLLLAEAMKLKTPRERTGKWTNVLHKVTKRAGAAPCPDCGATKLADARCPNCEPHLSEALAPVGTGVAEAYSGFHARVKALKPGEVARTPDGMAVRHHATDDARPAWSVGRPRTYRSSDEPNISWGEQHATPEAAVKDALTSSARSTDPNSLGGPRRYTTYDPVMIGGVEHRLDHVGVDALPRVRRLGMGPLQAKPADWSAMKPRDRMLEATGFASGIPMLQEAWSDAARLASAIARKRRAETRGALSAYKSGRQQHSLDHYTGPDGKLKPHRMELHEAIIAHHFEGATPQPKGKAKAVFVAGAPGSGKGGVRSKVSPKNHVLVDPDEIRKMLPEYDALRAEKHPGAAAFTHEESSHIAKEITRRALAGNHNVVIDKVGSGEPGKFSGNVKAAQAAGHKTEVHYVNTAQDTAIARAHKRANDPTSDSYGRHVNLDYQRASHQEVSARFPEVKATGADVHIHDNNGKKARLVYSNVGGKETVHDAAAVAAFHAKAKRTA